MISEQTARRELFSDTCACGRAKPPRKSLCTRCYHRLPEKTQQELYRRIGQGYEAAYEQALLDLELDMPGERCPKCAVLMEENDRCPECSHREGDAECECYYCYGKKTDD